MIQSVLSQIAEEFAERLGAVQNVGAGQFFYLRETLFAFRQLSDPVRDSIWK